MNKIVFLDCDGVLNRIPGGKDLRYFTPECFSEFRRIIAETGAKVVLSSSWREFPDWYNMLHDFLGAIGIHLIGKTDTQMWTDKQLWDMTCTNLRAEEIRAYAYENGLSESSYVVLDDWDMREEFPGHCVCTCAENRIGLDKEWADKAIAILNRKDTGDAACK